MEPGAGRVGPEAGGVGWTGSSGEEGVYLFTIEVAADVEAKAVGTVTVVY